MKTVSDNIFEEGALPTTSVIKLAWPIIIENLLYVSMGVVPAVILGRTSETGVAAVGTSYLIILFVVLIATPFAQGTTIALSRLLGAGRRDEAQQLGIAGIALNGLLGVVLSALVFTLRVPVASMLGLEGETLDLANTYLFWAGGTFFLVALILGLSAVLKAYGQTGKCMRVAIVSNSLGIACSWILIEGMFGVKPMGVMGVCIGILVARVLGCLLLLRQLLKSTFDLSHLRHGIYYLRRHGRQVVRYSIPVLLEPLAYQVGQIVLAMLVGKLGLDALITRAYVWSLMSYTMIIAIGFGQAAMIVVGYGHGAKNPTSSLRLMHRYMMWGLVTILIVLGIVYEGRDWFVANYVDADAHLMDLKILLQLCFVFDFARIINVVALSGLFALGEFKYPMLINLAFVWGMSVPVAYMLSMPLGLGLVGVMVAMVLDEVCRGFLNYWRFRRLNKRGIEGALVS